jgi:Fe-S-cluster containining protein
MSADLPECLACGACCHGDDGWVHVGADDDARVEGDVLLRELVVVTDRGGLRTHALRMVDGRCGALEVTGETARCRSYAARPAVCRALERGSRECLDAIARVRDATDRRSRSRR